MKRLFLFVLTIVVLFLLVTPALAQDTGGQEWTREDVALIGALFIAGVAVTFSGAAIIRLSGQLFQSAPPWVGDLVQDNLQRAIDEIQRLADSTPNQIDDALADYFDERLRKILEEARKQPPANPTS